MREVCTECHFQRGIIQQPVFVDIMRQQVEDLADHDRLENTEYNGYSGKQQSQDQQPFIGKKVFIKRGKVFQWSSICKQK